MKQGYQELKFEQNGVEYTLYYGIPYELAEMQDCIENKLYDYILYRPGDWGRFSLFGKVAQIFFNTQREDFLKYSAVSIDKAMDRSMKEYDYDYEKYKAAQAAKYEEEE